MGAPLHGHTPESLMGEALDSLHAADDLADRALAAARGSARRRGHAPRVATVLALAIALTLTLGGTAYAIVNSDLLARAYSGHGLGDTAAWSIRGDDGKCVYSFSQSLTPAAGEDVAQTIADATEPVNLTTTANGYTLTVESMVLDANGAGVATFTLASDHGFRLLPDAVPGELVFDGDSDLGLVSMEFPGGDFPDTRCYYDASASTDTELHGTRYFTSKGTDAFASGVAWVLGGTPGGDAVTGTFTPSRVVGTREFSDESGTVVSLSPLSLKASFSNAQGEHSMDLLQLSHADGTTQTVLDHDYDSGATSETNYYTSYRWDEGDDECIILSLSQITDPDTVDSVLMGMHRYANDGREDASCALTPTS